MVALVDAVGALLAARADAAKAAAARAWHCACTAVVAAPGDGAASCGSGG
jgi:hypothetical protein